jgi:hypothetical protein
MQIIIIFNLTSLLLIFQFTQVFIFSKRRRRRHNISLTCSALNWRGLCARLKRVFRTNRDNSAIRLKPLLEISCHFHFKSFSYHNFFSSSSLYFFFFYYLCSVSLLAKRATIHKYQTTAVSEANSSKSNSNIPNIIHFASAREASQTILFFLCERSELIDE